MMYHNESVRWTQSWVDMNALLLEEDGSFWIARQPNGSRLLAHGPEAELPRLSWGPWKATDAKGAADHRTLARERMALHTTVKQAAAPHGIRIGRWESGNYYIRLVDGQLLGGESTAASGLALIRRARRHFGDRLHA